MTSGVPCRDAATPAASSSAATAVRPANPHRCHCAGRRCLQAGLNLRAVLTAPRSLRWPTRSPSSASAFRQGPCFQASALLLQAAQWVGLLPASLPLRAVSRRLSGILGRALPAPGLCLRSELRVAIILLGSISLTVWPDSAPGCLAPVCLHHPRFRQQVPGCCSDSKPVEGISASGTWLSSAAALHGCPLLCWLPGRSAGRPFALRLTRSRSLARPMPASVSCKQSITSLVPCALQAPSWLKHQRRGLTELVAFRTGGGCASEVCIFCIDVGNDRDQAVHPVLGYGSVVPAPGGVQHFWAMRIRRDSGSNGPPIVGPAWWRLLFQGNTVRGLQEDVLSHGLAAQSACHKPDPVGTRSGTQRG
jgi:hypothetical protein